jgi:hypothetical protein
MSVRSTILATALLAATTAIASAQQTIDVDANSQSQSSSNSGAIAAGGNSTITFNSPGRVRQDIRQSGSLKTTPSMGAPGLGAAAVETCYGPGVSAAVSVTGFGIAAGAGQYDNSCNRRLNARTIFAFGHKREALAIMLNEPEVAAAFGAGGPGVVAVRAPVVKGDYVPMALASAKPTKAGCQRWRNNTIGDLCLD